MPSHLAVSRSSTLASSTPASGSAAHSFSHRSSPSSTIQQGRSLSAAKAIAALPSTLGTACGFISRPVR